MGRQNATNSSYAAEFRVQSRVCPVQARASVTRVTLDHIYALNEREDASRVFTKRVGRTRFLVPVLHEEADNDECR